MCVWIVRFGQILGLFLVKKMNIVKSAYMTLLSNPWLSKSTCNKILKIFQITKFDMGFQKNNMRSRLDRFSWIGEFL